MKRPLLFAAWGFVLGEVYLRLPMVWQILTLVLLAAGNGSVDEVEQERQKSGCVDDALFFVLFGWCVCGRSRGRWKCGRNLWKPVKEKKERYMGKL